MLKKRERIYIIPNWFGFMYGGGILASLITASTYSNNLVYALSFFMVGLFLIGMVQANANVKGTEVERFELLLSREDKPARAAIWIKNKTRSDKFLLQISIPELGNEFREVVNDVPAGASVRHDFKIPAQKVGSFSVNKIRLSSVFPLGTFFSWKDFKFSSKGYIYPKPAGGSEIPDSLIAGESIQKKTGEGGEDFSEHKKHQSGDSLQHIDWKAFARGRGLLSKQFNDGDLKEVSIELSNNLPQLRQASMWIDLCEKSKFPYRVSKNQKTLLSKGLGLHQQKKARLLLAKEACDAV